MSIKYNYLFVLLVVNCFCAKAQQKIRPSRFQHQIELGLNYTQYFSERKDYSGFGISSSRKEGGTNYNIAYKLTINNKHILKLAALQCSSNDISVFKNNYCYINAFSKIIELGYGYQVPIKQINFSVFGNLAYRYGGQETIQVFNPQIDWVTNKYNSIGASSSLEAAYFFSKNLGVGINGAYYLFPFESNKISIDNTQLSANSLQDFDSIKHFLNLNLKIIYKFKCNKI